MCDIVRISPQSPSSLSVKPHFLWHALQWLWPVRKRFSSDPSEPRLPGWCLEIKGFGAKLYRLDAIANDNKYTLGFTVSASTWMGKGITPFCIGTLMPVPQTKMLKTDIKYHLEWQRVIWQHWMIWRACYFQHWLSSVYRQCIMTIARSVNCPLSWLITRECTTVRWCWFCLILAGDGQWYHCRAWQ